MTKVKYGKAIVCAVCSLLIVSAFFAKEFTLYNFHMEVTDYRFFETDEEKPASVDTKVWFSLGTKGRELQYGLDSVSPEQVTVYSFTASGIVSASCP